MCLIELRFVGLWLHHLIKLWIRSLSLTGGSWRSPRPIIAIEMSCSKISVAKEWNRRQHQARAQSIGRLLDGTSNPFSLLTSTLEKILSSISSGRWEELLGGWISHDEWWFRSVRCFEFEWMRRRPFFCRHLSFYGSSACCCACRTANTDNLTKDI